MDWLVMVRTDARLRPSAKVVCRGDRQIMTEVAKTVARTRHAPQDVLLVQDEKGSYEVGLEYPLGAT